MTSPWLEDAAESVAMDDAVGLRGLWATWQARVAHMARCAEALGWEWTPPATAPGLTPTRRDQLARALGVAALPPQLAWALAQAGTWHVGWRATPPNLPRGALSGCSEGGIRETLWCAEPLLPLKDAMPGWVDMHAAQLREDEQPREADRGRGEAAPGLRAPMNAAHVSYADGRPCSLNSRVQPHLHMRRHIPEIEVPGHASDLVPQATRGDVENATPR